MGKHLYMLGRRFLEFIRGLRENLRPLGPFLARNVNKEDIEIRLVSEKDLDLMEAFITSGDYGKHRERYQAQKEGNAEYYIAWYLIPIGHIYIDWRGFSEGPLKDKREKDPMMEDLYIHPSVRNRGIGRMLMEFAENRIREMGYRRIGITVFANNPILEKRYKKMMYKESDYGTFSISRVFTDKRGRRKTWSKKVKYLTREI